MRMTPDTDKQSIRCSVCGCVCFKPGSIQMRSCDSCGHGWVAHALENLQLQAQPPSGCGPVEVALPGPVFDLSSLVLYRAQAVPVRLKILLDRLYSVLTAQQVSHILNILGWNLTDYIRGYMLQSSDGKVLDHWLMVTPDEELLVLNQFLRFGETRPIVELMTPRGLATAGHLAEPWLSPKSCQSSKSAFTEQNEGLLRAQGIFSNARGNSWSAASVCHSEKNNSIIHHFENLPGGLPLLLPFQIQSSAFHYLVPATKDVVPTKLMQWLRRLGAPKLEEMPRPEGGRRERTTNPISHSVNEPALKIKPDPDAPNPAWALWQQSHRIHSDQELNPDGGVAKEDTSSSFSPISSSSSCPLTSQRLQTSSSSCVHPFPSFSSSSSSSSSSFRHLYSSSLHPLPSSLCSLPYPSGGRKGRVCCGVCGKSFYDKGTLKIHYNAVHLKIKHRCTVAGCTMVFSSLRSRNRHSANPNPRLHTGTNRNAHTDTHSKPRPDIKDDEHTKLYTHPDRCHAHTGACRDVQRERGIQAQNDDTHKFCQHIHTLKNSVNGHTHIQHGDLHDAPSHPDSPPPLPSPHCHPSFKENSTHWNPAHNFASLHAPPPCRHIHARSTPSLITPETKVCHAPPGPVTEGRAGGGGGGGLCISPPPNQQLWYDSGDLVPKKKPRKSSAPVKIEREKMVRRKTEEEEE